MKWLGHTHIYIYTLAVKTVSEPIVFMDLDSSGIIEWRRQIMETYWPLFSESPTNIILFPLSVSSINDALKL